MALAKGLLSSLAKLEYSTDPATSTQTWVEVSVQEIPDLGQAPEMVDTTCLNHANRHSIPGIIDYGSLEFTCLFDADEFDALNDITGACSWKITFNDAASTSGTGSTFEWTGTPKVYTAGFGVNSAIQYKLVVGVESDMEFTPAA